MTEKTSKLGKVYRSVIDAATEALKSKAGAVMLSGALFLGGGTLACKASDLVPNKENTPTPIKSVDPGVKRYGLDVENEFVGETGDTISRLELKRDGVYIARVEHTDSADGSRDRYGAKIPISSRLFKGYFDLFGDDDSKGNRGKGFQFDGKMGSLILGGGAESSSRDIDKRLLNLYTGLDLGRSMFSIGMADVKRGDDKRTVTHGTFSREFDNPENFVVALGGMTDDSGDHYGHMTFGQYPKEPGKGFGWKFGARSEMEGDVNLFLLLSLDAPYGKSIFQLPYGRYGSCHEGRIRATDNIMEADTPIPFWKAYQRTNDLAALRMYYKRNGDGKGGLSADGAVYPTNVLRRMGADIGESPLDRLWIGGEYDAVKGNLTGELGIKLPYNIVVYTEIPEGGNPSLFVRLGSIPF
jgi:hypothetical protein